ncbi:DeoR/GlpR family DNA-binding transcription regulator [Agromyces aerolatus]|uniref:DeoR/GlpR family DNA-binding transcription regulator n=1 Tax=Agromyces sp. LY-1074 TaxID=3074080 RepID=UPI00285942BC|nr:MULTISPECIES: DeoR/GlpR family DNA-binding transcription regulator [unclassified Agromyces]MDR5700482.1 DeoR/GlpR family DNA-binding transcription regulator [Agromyces sp. LY-1074]MDR5707003.1 DeoR/GlpR family DNA-binding transcription regulator [Agromyces sp. LY-1358]
MNRAERLNTLLDMLAETGRLEVDDLVAKLGVSAATARRDLDTLAAQQLLSRTHGGAVAQSVAYDLPLRYKQERQASEKNEIAQVASSLVPTGAVVGLCGGTTSTAIANALAARADLLEPSPHPNLTVVTNAINIAAQLAMRPQIKVVVTGGVVHSRSYELVGPYSDMVLERITLDIAFIGVNGIDPVMGATVHDEGEASINSLMARRAARAVVVADSSKIGRKAFATMGGAHLFGTLITDRGITDKQKAAFTELGIEVLVAEA